MVKPRARGEVVSLSVDGKTAETLNIGLRGPVGDRHTSFTRTLGGHDRGYIKKTALEKGETVFNWRTWTGLSREEIRKVEEEIGCPIPPGILLENLIVEGIQNFSLLPCGTLLVFPRRQTQLVLAVWEENGPCQTSGRRLEEHHGVAHLSPKFISAAQHRRGVMGFVLSPGRVDVGDGVEVHLPIVR